MYSGGCPRFEVKRPAGVEDVFVKRTLVKETGRAVVVPKEQSKEALVVPQKALIYARSKQTAHIYKKGSGTKNKTKTENVNAMPPARTLVEALPAFRGGKLDAGVENQEMKELAYHG